MALLAADRLVVGADFVAVPDGAKATHRNFQAEAVQDADEDQ